MCEICDLKRDVIKIRTYDKLLGAYAKSRQEAYRKNVEEKLNELLVIIGLSTTPLYDMSNEEKFEDAFERANKLELMKIGMEAVGESIEEGYLFINN